MPPIKHAANTPPPIKYGMRDFFCSFFLPGDGFRVVFAGCGRRRFFVGRRRRRKLKSANSFWIADCTGAATLAAVKCGADAQHLHHLLFIVRGQARPAFRQQQIVQPRRLPQRLRDASAILPRSVQSTSSCKFQSSLKTGALRGSRRSASLNSRLSPLSNWSHKAPAADQRGAQARRQSPGAESDRRRRCTAGLSAATDAENSDGRFRPNACRPGRAPTCRRNRSVSGRACSARRPAPAARCRAASRHGRSRRRAAGAVSLRPHLHQSVQVLRLAGVVADELVEREAFDPFHLQERNHWPRTRMPSSKILEADREREAWPSSRCSSILA